MNPTNGAITALQFFTPHGRYNPTHLLSGSADGALSIWTTGGGWECLKTMRGHKKEVTAIAVHPSGKVSTGPRAWFVCGVSGQCGNNHEEEGWRDGVTVSGGFLVLLLCEERSLGPPLSTANCPQGKASPIVLH
jgi:WD40 repeat protein